MCKKCLKVTVRLQRNKKTTKKTPKLRIRVESLSIYICTDTLVLRDQLFKCSSEVTLFHRMCAIKQLPTQPFIILIEFSVALVPIYYTFKNGGGGVCCCSL